MRCLIPINIRGVQYGKGACGGTGGWGIALQSRKFAGSIPDGVIGIFHLHNPSGRTMALGLIQPLTEMSTRNISRETKVAGELGWQYYHFHVPIVSKSGFLNLLDPNGLQEVCIGIFFTFFPLTCFIHYLGISVTCKLMLHVTAKLVVGTKMKCRQYPLCVRRSDGTEHRVIITAMYSDGLRLKPRLSWFSPLLICSNSNWNCAATVPSAFDAI